MNWAEYSKYVGDIFGAPLAIEATVAFFLESVFIGLWIFGWDKVSRKVHALSIWIVALASNLSALWILLANGWMQHPVGYVLRNGRAEMVDFTALITNPYGLVKFVHTVLSGYMVASFFVMGIAAYHLLKGNQIEFFKRSFKIGATFGVIASIFIFLTGDYSSVVVAKTQPAKFAAMESIWETRQGVGMNLFLFPNEEGECNAVERFCIPNMVSILAFHTPNAEIKGLKEFPRDLRPPILPTFLSFRLMVGLGTLMVLASLLGFVLSRWGKLEDRTLYLKFMLLAIPLPYLAAQLGWIVAEVGRQPWIVYGVLKTADAVSRSVSVAQVVGSLAGFTLLYGGLGVIDIYLLAKTAKRGPDA
jgi:cytochrome d ubiquinol oxidase subunit I